MPSGGSDEVRLRALQLRLGLFYGRAQDCATKKDFAARHANSSMDVWFSMAMRVSAMVSGVSRNHQSGFGFDNFVRCICREHIRRSGRRRPDFDSDGRLWRRGCGQSLVEIRGQIDEVGDGDLAVVIEIAFGIGGVGFADVRGEGDEIGDGDSPIAIQVAFERKEIEFEIGSHGIAGRVSQVHTVKRNLVVAVWEAICNKGMRADIDLLFVCRIEPEEWWIRDELPSRAVDDGRRLTRCPTEARIEFDVDGLVVGAA